MSTSRTNLVNLLTSSSQDALTSLRVILTGSAISNGAKLPLRTAYRTFAFVALGCLVGVGLFSTPLLTLAAVVASASTFVLGSTLQDV